MVTLKELVARQTTRKLILYHCMLSKKIWITIVEGKENPTKDTYVESKFEREFGSKIAVLVVIMTETIWRY